MPLYEYHCTACAHRFERIVKFSDPVLRTCPKCGKDAIEQLISAPAVQFKGSGWYVTDYARKNSTPAATSSASTAKAETASETASASKDSTPAATANSTGSPAAPSTSGGSAATSASN